MYIAQLASTNVFWELLIAVQMDNKEKGKTHGKSKLDISSAYNLKVKAQRLLCFIQNHTINMFQEVEE
jgi:hypothetical protein